MADWNKDENGRRYGDWQHRDLRKDDTVAPSPVQSQQKPWYLQNFWIIIFLLVFWPIGIVLCWKSSWLTVVKIIVSLLVLASVAGVIWIYTNRA